MLDVSQLASENLWRVTRQDYHRMERLGLLGDKRVEQNPVIAHDESEPEPDLAVVPPGDYSERHPDRAFLLIEVADTTVRKDRLIKGPLYAESGFPEYWLVNLTERVVEVHRGPQGSAWRLISRHGRDESLAPDAFPDMTLPIAEFLH